MKIATIVVRVLLGLLFLFASISYFAGLITPPEVTGPMKVFNDGLEASVYIMPVVKAIELICGIAFVVGRYVRLAVVVIFPIVVNIVAPEGLPVALFVLFATLFLVYANREHYRSLLVSK